MEIISVGGYNEVGKNMTALKIGEDAVIFDAGIYLPAIVEMQEAEDKHQAYSEKKLRGIGALPDDLVLDRLGIRNQVRAILPSHAHLDHIGALPYLAYRYNAPIASTPFTIALLKKILEDDHATIPNKMHSVQPNASFTIRGKKRNYQAEFINMTHSTPHTAVVAVHTPEGVVVYANDYKLDNSPVLGLPPNYDALKRLAKEGVKALIVDSLYSGLEAKTPSEKIARAMIEETLITVENRNAAVFVSTFSSHIARLKSIVDYAKKLNRKVFFLGRSLNKYVSAAAEAGVCPFRKDVYIASYKNQVQSILKKVEKDRKNTLVVCTGHQGEPGSIMERLSRKDLPFAFQKHDNIVFSSKTIPVPANIANKENMDKRFKKFGVRIFDNVHVSGHGGREDLRDLISILNPQHVVPSHGSTQQLIPALELAKELGYKVGKTCHLVQDSGVLKL
jgi:ribonuclease J